MKVLIVEDEKAAVRNLRALLADVAPSYEVAGVTDSIRGTVDWIGANRAPDLIFMDIHLADGSAFEIFERVTIHTPVVFTTAYDEYALRAFRVNSIDYLLKPIGEKELRRALDKFETLKPENNQPDEDAFSHFIRSMSKHENYKTHFLIPVKGSKLRPLSIDAVDYFCVTEGIVRAMTRERETIVMPQTMEELVESLDPDRFFRVNRQYLVTREAIDDMELWFNGRLSINLKRPADDKIIVSKARVSEFKKWFVLS